MIELNENQQILWTVLLQIKEIFDYIGCPFFLIGGTLLGFIRDGEIISWDKDVDIGVFEEYEPLLEKVIAKAKQEGWTTEDWGFGRMFGNRGRLTALYKPEYKRSEQDSHLDVFMLYRHRDIFWYGCGGEQSGYNQIAVFPKEYLNNLSTITVKSVTFNVPNPPEEYLKHQYGENWKTPISNEDFNKDVLSMPHFDKDAVVAKEIKDSWIRKITIVTEFEQKDFFQWLIALNKYKEELKIEVTPVIASISHRKIHKLDDPYWNPIRTAEFIFVYVTRMEKSLEWWTLPKFVKQLMHPKAKMITQYDDEFMWLFHPETTWWNYPNPPNTGPEQFFNDTGILDIPTVHLCVMEKPLFKEYSKKKSVYQLMLPQLNRYDITKYSLEHKTANIAMLIHSPWQASIENSTVNIIKPKNYPVTVFTNKRNATGPNYCGLNELPVGSRAFGYIPRDSFVDLLWQCSIALDDNTNYIGWSRFVMECAIAYVPCVGSTEAVKILFPELHTAPQDYTKQIELIEKLQTDKKFYQRIAKDGYARCIEYFDEKKLCQKLMEIFESIDNWWSE